MVLIYFREVKARIYMGRILVTLILAFHYSAIAVPTGWTIYVCHYIQKKPRRTPTVPEGVGVVARALAGKYCTNG